MKNFLGVLCGVTLMGVTVAGANPVQLSLTPDIAIYESFERIEGVSLSIWGENPQSAFALGFVNGSTGQSAGLSLAILFNYSDSYKGVQFASVNYTDSDFVGWQGGLVNYTDGQMKGFQTGVVNYAGRLTGLQLGIINYAESAVSGIQLGLINFIPENGWFNELPDELAPGMVFVNWKF